MYEEAVVDMMKAFKQTRLYKSNPTNGLIGFSTQDFTHFIPGRYQAMQADFSKLSYCPTARISRKIFLDELMEGCQTKTEKLNVREKYREATRHIWSPAAKSAPQEIPVQAMAQKAPRVNYDLFEDIAEEEHKTQIQMTEDEKEALEMFDLRQHDESVYRSMVAVEFN